MLPACMPLVKHMFLMNFCGIDQQQVFCVVLTALPEGGTRPWKQWIWLCFISVSQDHVVVACTHITHSPCAEPHSMAVLCRVSPAKLFCAAFSTIIRRFLDQYMTVFHTTSYTWDYYCRPLIAIAWY